jgi:3-dehydroquinate dehydratase
VLAWSSMRRMVMVALSWNASIGGMGQTAYLCALRKIAPAVACFSYSERDSSA